MLKNQIIVRRVVELLPSYWGMNSPPRQNVVIYDIAKGWWKHEEVDDAN